MSIRLMAQVWAYEFDHPEQSVMQALADHADDDGNHVYPSVAYVAWKTGYSVRQTQRIMGGLQRAGVLIIVKKAGQHRPTEYRIRLAAAQPKPPFRDAKLAPLENSGMPLRAPGMPSDDARDAITGARDATAMASDSSYEPLNESPIETSLGASAPGGDAAPSPAGTRAIQAAYVAELGYAPADWAAGESKAAKAIGAKYTLAQFIAAYRYYKGQQFWADKRLGLAHLVKQMPEYIRMGTKGGRINGSAKHGNLAADGGSGSAGEGGGDDSNAPLADRIANRLSR